MAPTLNYGKRLKRWALTPPELDAKINIAEGSIRAGKSWALHAKALYGCQYPVTGWKVFTGVTKETVYRNVLYDLASIVGTSNFSYNHQSGRVRLCGTDWVVIGAHDEGSEQYIRGLTIGYCIADELVFMPQGFFEMLLTRLSPPGSRLYGSTNADSPLHYLKTNYLDNRELRENRLLDSIHVTMDDNPNLTEQFKNSQKMLYRGLFFRRFIEGLWVMAEGSIYRDVWDEKRVLFDDSDMSEIMKAEVYGGKTAGLRKARWVTVDYGTDNPCCFLDWWDDGKVIWIMNQYYWDSHKEMRQKTDGEYAADLDKFVGGDRKAQIIVDPSAASLKAEFQKKKFWVSDAKNDVLPGIQKSSACLAKGIVRIHRQRCKQLIQDMEVYAWDPKKSARGIEEPLHANSHGPDSFRYGCETKIPSWRLM
jgi:PBSX family phage terminase large subunit